MATGTPVATTEIKVVANFKGDILEWGRVVWGDRGQPFCFQVSKQGTVEAAQVITSIAGLCDYEEDVDVLLALINSRVGVIRENNPKWEDVKTDNGGNAIGGGTTLTDTAGNDIEGTPGFSGGAGDATEDDGVNDGTRYGWCREGQLYTAIKV